MKIREIPMDVAFEHIGATHVFNNNIEVIKLAGEEYSSDGFKRRFKLTQNNLKNFIKILGHPRFKYKGEYMENVWVFDYEDITVVLYTGNRGTSYEVRSEQSFADFRHDTELGKKLNRFTSWLMKEILKIDPMEETL